MILGRGGAGKSTLAGQLGEVLSLPAGKLARYPAYQWDVSQCDGWIVDCDVGPYGDTLDVRLRTTDTVIVLDFAFLRCAWRSIRRAGIPPAYWRWVRAWRSIRRGTLPPYWRWVWEYRRRSLPKAMQMIAADAPHAKVYVLRNPRMVRRFVAGLPQDRPQPVTDNSDHLEPGSRRTCMVKLRFDVTNGRSHGG